MAVTLDDILTVFSFGIGACIASFLNVVIWRVPRGESIVSPPSHCPKCNAAIRWYQNIPIVSWLALRGKCANCKAPISPRYVIIELLGAILFSAAYFRFGVSFELVIVWFWLSLMIVGSAIDCDLKLLPDFVTVGGMVLGVVFGIVESIVGRSYLPMIVSGSGLAFGFGIFWLIRFLGSKAFGREAMGMGDVFLMGAVGAISGPVAVFFVLIFSSLFGSVVGLTMVALSKTRLGGFAEIPFGPYICFAHLFYLFHGTEMVSWYMNLMR